MVSVINYGQMWKERKWPFPWKQAKKKKKKNYSPQDHIHVPLEPHLVTAK